MALLALAVLLQVRVRIGLGGFARVQRWLEHTEPDAGGVSDPAATARAIRRAVIRAARTVPGSSCLPMSATAFRLLRRAGCAAELTIGVRAGASASDVPLAHAWVRSGDVIVIGDTDGVEPSAYTPLTTLGAR